jgi:hypothetical protein
MNKSESGRIIMGSTSAFMNIGNRHKATVDTEDLPRLSIRRWYSEKRDTTIYASSNYYEDGKEKKIYMHTVVLGQPPVGMEIDHINGNGLDNRKENLRFCTHRQNCQARRKRNKNVTSKYKGVSWLKDSKKWRARIYHADGYREHLGYFESEIEAAKAYDKAALELFGDFATCNFANPKEIQARLF